MLFLVHGLQLLFGYHCEKWAADGVAEAVKTVLLARPAKTQAAECLAYVCVCVLVAQSCPILCDPMDCSLPGSSVHGISLCVCVCVCVRYLFSHVWLFATPRNVAHQAPLSMGLPRQEYWSESPFPSPGDLPNPGIKPRSLTLQADSLLSEPPEKPSIHA